jgi:uncharacterized membrane protein (UPF0136 family)
MWHMNWLSIAVLIYGILMLGGGVMGFVTSGSVPSLISGLISGVLLIAAAFMTRSYPKAAYTLATVVTVALIAVFVERFMKTHKVMPSLGLVGLSVVMLILLIVGHFIGNRAGSPEPGGVDIER